MGQGLHLITMSPVVPVQTFQLIQIWQLLLKILWLVLDLMSILTVRLEGIRQGHTSKVELPILIGLMVCE